MREKIDQITKTLGTCFDAIGDVLIGDVPLNSLREVRKGLQYVYQELRTLPDYANAISKPIPGAKQVDTAICAGGYNEPTVLPADSEGHRASSSEGVPFTHDMANTESTSQYSA